jgi:hypothetical protein
MLSLTTRSLKLRRGLTAVFALTSLGSALAMHAQAVTASPAVNFKAYTAPNLFAAADPTTSPSSSEASSDANAGVSSSTNLATIPVDPLHLNAMQYERRRYGRPRYRGSNTNPDGSDKYIFYGGGGFVQPTSDTYNTFTPNYGVQIGGGRQFSAHFALPIEFDYDTMGLTRQAIANQSYIYFGTFNAAVNQMDAKAHIWNFSVNPQYTLFNGATADGLGVYLVGSVGFYHKVTNFTVPQQEEYCDYYYGCGVYEVNGTFDDYTSNAPGFGGGLGLTYKLSHFSNIRLYAEAKYIYVDNSFRPGYTEQQAAANVPYNGNNYFPANSVTTTMVPVKFGIRF